MKISYKITNYISYILLCFLLSACASRIHIQNPLPPRSFNTFSRLSIEHIELSKSAGAEAAPYLNDVEFMVKEMGFEVVDRSKASLHLLIESRTEPLGARYTSLEGNKNSYWYTGAESSGTITVQIPDSSPMKVMFDGIERPGRFSLRSATSNNEDPASAPFREAFRGTGGFYRAFYSIFYTRIPDERFTRISNYPLSEAREAFFRFCAQNDIRSAAPSLMEIMRAGHFYQNEIVLTLARWRYEPVLDYALMMTEHPPIFVSFEELLVVHETFQDKRSIPAIAEYMKKKDGGYPNAPYEGRDSGLKVLRSLVGQDLGNDPRDYEQWYSENQ
ncbi:MAG TPA: hypothetical protein DEA96_02765 [Leptospiraceae bacterium]|nr:hypothetical protein [Spirochaetaceae bacterium]HBS03859.1 hypothetical protein [Leptospiraceae bacterium]